MSINKTKGNMHTEYNLVNMHTKYNLVNNSKNTSKVYLHNT